MSASGRRLWAQTAEAPELAFSRDRPLRDNTLYTWRVFGTFPDKSVKQLHEANFTTANESQRAEAKGLHELAEAPEAPFQAAAALNYERLKLLAEAIPLYEKLVKESPETAGFHAALAELYHKAGRVKEAAQAREAAEKLGFDFARPTS